jgi:hypothetical protein
VSGINTAAPAELRPRIRQRAGRRHRDRVGNKTASLFDKPGDVLTSGHRDDAEAIGVRGNDRKRALTD